MLSTPISNCRTRALYWWPAVNVLLPSLLVFRCFPTKWQFIYESGLSQLSRLVATALGSLLANSWPAIRFPPPYDYISVQLLQRAHPFRNHPNSPFLSLSPNSSSGRGRFINQAANGTIRQPQTYTAWESQRPFSRPFFNNALVARVVSTEFV